MSNFSGIILNFAALSSLFLSVGVTAVDGNKKKVYKKAIINFAVFM
ncbi:hypothetical protein RintRC_1629 [Richelia intracellularis]|nr:hypothetical protein RintRC_1629 [Richelia intracellularis]